MEQEESVDILEQFDLEMVNEARNHINGVHILTNNQTNDDNEQPSASTSRKKDNNDNADDDYDQLFYNPDEDESNQQWINSKVFQDTSRQCMDFQWLFLFDYD